MKFFTYLVLPFFYALIGNYIRIDELEFRQVKVEYGNFIENNDSDGYFKILDKSDDMLIKEVFYDSNANDYFRYLAIVDKTSFLVVCDSFYFSEEYTMPVYRDSVILKYNLDGVLLDKIPLNQRPSEYHNHNNLLILGSLEDHIIIDKDLKIIDSIQESYTVTASFNYQYQGQAYINNTIVDNLIIEYPGHYDIKIIDGGYSFEFNVTVEADYKILGQKYVEGYLGEVSFFSFGELLLDGQPYNIGASISEVGEYHMVIVGENDYRKDVYFTILPDISYNDGEVEGQLIIDSSFDKPIRIYSNAQSMFLNGVFYNSGFINNVGSHKIEFYGVNGYVLELTFNILPKISGLENDRAYENVSFNVFGEALLNGSLITGEISLFEPGDYRLDLLFNGEVYETYNFQILEQEVIETEKEIDYSEYFKYIFVLVALIGGVLILRKR